MDEHEEILKQVEKMKQIQPGSDRDKAFITLIFNMNIEINTLKSKINEQENKIEALSTHFLDENSMSIEDYKERAIDYEKKALHLEGLNTLLRNELEALKKEIKDLEKELKQYRNWDEGFKF